ncbi:7941_t:CDS:2 [Acaulospora colombiana]|uniref:7941_t:CDS:1 n=1 Tax=Acaulospora colombiana TaxID=27376 RepID=A0ACA9N278_9GLOM|nr:7941_t:CDS:2 [Acaulospora colombiana]
MKLKGLGQWDAEEIGKQEVTNDEAEFLPSGLAGLHSDTYGMGFSSHHPVLV